MNRMSWGSMTQWLRGALLAASMLVSSVHAEKVVTYYHTDPAGNVLATTDAAGNLLSQSERRPYGERVMGAPESGPGYAGHVDDPDTGLVYMQARYYDPSIGRFISRDPAGLIAGDIHGISRYSYANNNPIGNIDPDGRQTVPGTIDWQAPGMVEGWKSAGRDVTIPALIDLLPGGGTLNCAMRGCSGGEWAMSIVPLSGEIRGPARAAAAMAHANRVGRQGEAAMAKALGIAKNTKRYEVNGRLREPDFVHKIDDVTLKPTIMTEVKNVKYQAHTQQLKDYADLARPAGRVDVALPPGARVSGPLQEAFDKGDNPLNRIDLPK